MIFLKKRKIILISTFSFIILLISISLIYLNTEYKAHDYIKTSLVSNDTVEVKKDNKSIKFIPKNYEDCIIFYQGAKVDELSYAPLMMELAKNGVLGVIVKMPFNFAIFGKNKANAYVEEYKNLDIYMMGHSLGGAMACDFASKCEEIDGVILLASYSTKDISYLKTLSIYGENDLVLNKDNYNKYKSNLPSDFTEIIIEGGNHAGFGYYGPQKNDGNLEIKKEIQINITVEHILNFI